MNEVYTMWQQDDTTLSRDRKEIDKARKEIRAVAVRSGGRGDLRHVNLKQPFP
jgi:hypothetical protein